MRQHRDQLPAETDTRPPDPARFAHTGPDALVALQRLAGNAAVAQRVRGTAQDPIVIDDSDDEGSEPDLMSGLVSGLVSGVVSPNSWSGAPSGVVSPELWSGTPSGPVSAESRSGPVSGPVTPRGGSPVAGGTDRSGELARALRARLAGMLPAGTESGKGKERVPSGDSGGLPPELTRSSDEEEEWSPSPHTEWVPRYPGGEPDSVPPPAAAREGDEETASVALAVPAAGLSARISSLIAYLGPKELRIAKSDPELACHVWALQALSGQSPIAPELWSLIMSGPTGAGPAWFAALSARTRARLTGITQEIAAAQAWYEEIADSVDPDRQRLGNIRAALPRLSASEARAGRKYAKTLEKEIEQRLNPPETRDLVHQRMERMCRTVVEFYGLPVCEPAEAVASIACVYRMGRGYGLPDHWWVELAHDGEVIVAQTVPDIDIVFTGLADVEHHDHPDYRVVRVPVAGLHQRHIDTITAGIDAWAGVGETEQSSSSNGDTDSDTEEDDSDSDYRSPPDKRRRTG